jgi:hypothetical protein
MKVTKFKIVSHFGLLARTQSTNLAIFFPQKHCRNLATKKPKNTHIYIFVAILDLFKPARAEFSQKKEERKAACFRHSITMITRAGNHLQKGLAK